MNHPAAFVDSTDGETASVEDVHAGASSDVHFTIKMTLNSKPSCGIDNLGNTRTACEYGDSNHQSNLLDPSISDLGS